MVGSNKKSIPGAGILPLKCKCMAINDMYYRCFRWTIRNHYSFSFLLHTLYYPVLAVLPFHCEVPVVGSLEFHIPSSYRSWTAPLTAAGTSLSRAGALLATSYQITDGCKKGRKGKIRSKVNLLLSLPGEYQRVIYPSRTDVTLISHTSWLWLMGFIC